MSQQLGIVFQLDPFQAFGVDPGKTEDLRSDLAVGVIPPMFFRGMNPRQIQGRRLISNIRGQLPLDPDKPF